jgi:hypothetical protein
MATTTPDLSEFHDLARPRSRKPPCKVKQAIGQLQTSDESVQATAALATTRETIPDGAIVGWFERRDLQVSVAAVTSHRRGRCTCANG